MSTTAQQIFDAAIGIIDELDDRGNANSPDTTEYKNRTLFILNTLRGELFPYSDTYQNSEGTKRPVCPVISDFETDLEIDDVIAQTVMPYGLAAHLMLDENPSVASFCQQRYEELLARIGTQTPSESESITDVYGGIGFRYGSMWG